MADFRAHDGYGSDVKAELAWCHMVTDELLKHYPGHRWFVEAGSEAGTVTIKLFYPDKLGRVSRCGVLIHLNSLKTREGLKKIMRLGGELLERFGLPRSRAPEDARLIARDRGLIMDGAR